MLNRGRVPDSAHPLRDLSDLLCDALAAILGENAAVFRDRPRDWAAVEAAAQEIVKGETDDRADRR